LFNQQLDKRINSLFELHHGLYGYRRLHAELLDEGCCLSRERVRRRIHKLNLKAKQRRKYKHTTDSNHNKPVADNLLDRNFKMSKTNQACATAAALDQVPEIAGSASALIGSL